MKVKFKAFFAKIGNFFKKAWERKFETVNSLTAWCIYGGVLALAVILALIFWL